jgi:hypothetical protein
MIPTPIQKQLKGLRRRERCLRFVWGVARWLALVLIALALACLIDWLIDRAEETPLVIRQLLLAAQIGLGIAAIAYLVVWPLLGALPLSKLALWIEEKVPRLGQRLISTVQFHQAGARTEGMSREMIAVVSQETERHMAHVNAGALADHRRLSWSVAVLAPVLLVLLVVYLLTPATAWALLQRQLLNDHEIPRSVVVASATREIWPSGEEVVLRFRATGSGANSSLDGSVRVEPEGQARADYELAFETTEPSGAALYSTRVPASSVNFNFRARLGDSRWSKSERVRFVPRPAIVAHNAWVILPEHVGLRPSKRPYEVVQVRGDIVGVPHLGARVEIGTQKPIQRAVLELLGPAFPDLSASRDSEGQRQGVQHLWQGVQTGLSKQPFAAQLAAAVLEAGKIETVRRRLEQTFAEAGQKVEWTFALRPTETAYRILVFDEYDFANVPVPRRNITLEPEKPPQVTLLRERFMPRREFISKGPLEDYELDGIPIPLDKDGRPGPTRISYAASGHYGLGHARLRIQVIKKTEGSEEDMPASEENWPYLPLVEVADPSERLGPFDPRRGAFVGSDEDHQVPFHAVPSSDPERTVPRIVGGGRFDYKTAGIPDGKGGLIDLKPGDQVAFYVEVFNRHPDGKLALAGRSETRVKSIVTQEEFVRWTIDTLQEESYIRQLEARQRELKIGGK